VMEDFSKVPGVKDFSNMKDLYTMFVDVVVSKYVCQYLHDIKLHITLSNSTDNMYRFDDEVKDDGHGFSPPK
jgi:hypothetical protein